MSVDNSNRRSSAASRTSEIPRTRSISTSDSVSNGHNGPGSPYRGSSGSLAAISSSSGGGGSRPNLSKELLQKLRSMTETIKMLSDENTALREQCKNGHSPPVENGQAENETEEDGGDQRRGMPCVCV